MTKYYAELLSGKRLQQCYDLAPPRVRQYLLEEIRLVRNKIGQGDHVLELGCGYGRVLNELSGRRNTLFGIDNSYESLRFAKNSCLKGKKIRLACMDALHTGFYDRQFDVVFCIQNGISAFGSEPELLLDEALRILKPKGKLLLSSYSGKFWEQRLNWFRIQAAHGLIGEIDDNLTGNGVIICRDGFRATTFGPLQFEKLLSGKGREYQIYEVDESSLFCEITA